MTSIDLKSWKKRIAAADAAELDAIDQELFGRKAGVLTTMMKELGSLSVEEKKKKGVEMNALKTELTELMDERRSELEHESLSSLATDDALDPTLQLPPRSRGHLHLIPEFIREVEELFGRMGFDVARGDEVESEDYNFFKLNFEKDHPALDMQATFFVKDRPGMVLRTHTSPVQIHYMETHKPPFRMICPGRVYRKDADATHSPMFHQFEGLMIGADVSMSNMKAVMITAMKALLGENIEFRFRTSYFPFVEPGLEVDIRWTSGLGGPSRWLEVVGCGMVHPNVLKNAGVDTEKWQGFAFGFGIERLLMIRHNIKDLRAFYEGDVRFLAQF